MDTQNQYQQQPLTNYNKDVESQQGDTDIQTMLRIGFIRKVYGILSFQLLLTVFFCSLTFIDSVNLFFRTHVAIFWVCLVVSIFLIIPLICCKSIARTVPTNYIILTLWTICESYMVAMCCSTYPAQVVIAAASMTCAVTVALTLYACTTKTDFTFAGGLLFVATILLICLGIFSFFTGFLNTLYCVLGVLLYSIYLIYDTQLVMGKFGLEYVSEDYILAALMIYIDIIQIFLYLLQLFGRR